MLELLGVSVWDLIDLPTILMGAGGLMFAYKMLKDAKKPIVAILLIVAVGFVALRFMPGQQEAQPQQPGGLFGLLSGLQGMMGESTKPKPRPPGYGRTHPLPRYPRPKKGEPPLPPRTYAEMHKPAIDDLERQRFAKIVEPTPKMPPKLVEYLNPQRRANVVQVALAKEIARRGSVYLVTAEDREQKTTGFASIAPSPPRMMKPWEADGWALDMAERRINDAQALSRQIAAKYGRGK